MALMYRSVHETPDLGAVPPLLRELVASCLEKNPGHRPGTPQLLDAFDALAGAATSYRLAPPRPSMPPDVPPHVPPRVAPYVPTVSEPAADQGPGQAPVPDDEAFIAADTDSSLVVDADGVLLTLHGRGLPLDQIETDDDLDQGGAETEFSWSEIADVTHGIVRRSRLHVTVTLHDGSTFEGEINARRGSRVEQWQRDLAEAVMRHLIR